MHSMSENIGLRTSDVMPDREDPTILRFTKSIINTHHKQGFEVKTIDVDLEFDSLKEKLSIPVNVVDKNTHVHAVERSIRTIKERIRCTIQSLPFSCIPKLIIEGAVAEATENLNRLPRRGGVSPHLSPLTIVCNAPKLDFNLLKLTFGDYVEVYEDNGFQTNSPNTRGTPAIALNPVYNSTGSYYFFSLVTGRRLNRGIWTPLPMPQWVIDRVNDMGAAEGRPLTTIIDFSIPGDDEMPDLLEHADNDDDSTFVPDDAVCNDDDISLDQDNDVNNSDDTFVEHTPAPGPPLNNHINDQNIPNAANTDENAISFESDSSFDGTTDAGDPDTSITDIAELAALGHPVQNEDVPLASSNGPNLRRSDRLAGRNPLFSLHETNLANVRATSTISNASSQKDY